MAGLPDPSEPRIPRTLIDMLTDWMSLKTPLIEAALAINDNDTRFYITNFLSQAKVDESLINPDTRAQALQILTDSTTADKKKKERLYQLIPPPEDWSSFDRSYNPSPPPTQGGTRRSKPKPKPAPKRNAPRRAPKF